MHKRLISVLVCFTFIFSNFQYVHAQVFNINQLPLPGIMVSESGSFTPLALKGLIVNPQKPLEFQFIVDTGHGPQDTTSIKDQSNQLVKYFLTGLTVPESNLWVNLSPYEKDRIVPAVLGQTELGRDLLAQDYILKQLTASLIYPEKDLGKEFWSRIYAKAQEQFGTTNVPVNTFNKVWILPNQAQVFESANGAYVTKSTLKVMLDEDYLAKQKHQATQASSISSQIVRAIVLPEIEKEVNTGKNFALLRQIYQALILAKWYKETIQNGLLDMVYTNKNKVAGVNLNNPEVKEEIYQRYLKAYKKGVFNYIKEDPTLNGQYIPRKYFSGGITKLEPDKIDRNGRQTDVKVDGAMIALEVDLESFKDKAMNIDQRALVINQAVVRIENKGLLIASSGGNGSGSKYEKQNLVIAMKNALNAVAPRYNKPEQRAELEALDIVVEENNGSPLSRITTDQSKKTTIYIQRKALISLPYLTILLIGALDKYISNPISHTQKATEEVLNNLEEILYFLNLSIASKADFINFVNRNIKDDKGSYKFQEGEFNENMTPDALITALNKDEIVVPEGNTSIERLNKLLEKQDLYLEMGEAAKKLKVSVDSIRNLSLFELIKLNRLLIEEKYKIHAPKKQRNMKENEALLKILLNSIGNDTDALKIITEILKEQYLWSSEDAESLISMANSNRYHVKFNHFKFAMDYTRTKNPEYSDELATNPRFQQLAELFSTNINFLREIKTITDPKMADNRFYEEITRDEANATGTSPSLVVLGAINLKRGNPVDEFILSRSQQMPEISKAKIGSLYLGGGGASATSIGRAIKYYNKQRNKSNPNAYDNVNIVAPFDDGGSSRRDQQAIRDVYGKWLPSPGDTAAILSWQTISDRDWYADSSNYTIPGFSPELRNAILQLIFSDKKRLTVPLHSTLEEVVEKRIINVVNDGNLMNPHSIPPNWYSFIINLKGIAHIIDTELIKTGKMDDIENLWNIESSGEVKGKAAASVQNLVYLAGMIATRNNGEFDIEAGMYLLHKILGIDTNFALPSSTKEAVLSLQLRSGTVKEDNFFDIDPSDSSKKRQIWDELIEQGYIDRNGVIQDKFYKLDSGSSMFLPVSGIIKSQRQQVYNILQNVEPTKDDQIFINQQTKISDLSDVSQKDFPAYVKYDGIYPRPAYEMVFKKSVEKSEDASGFQQMMNDDVPGIYSPAVDAIKHTENIIYTGMGSPFDSILPNLMVRGVIEALEKKKEEVPIVYFPKPTFDIQTEGLRSFQEIFEVMERSIREVSNQPGFTMGNIFTHFVVPKVSKNEVDNYVIRVKRDLKKYLTEDAIRRIEKSDKQGNDALILLKSIVLDDKNLNEGTLADVHSGKLKRSKLVPGIIIAFTEADRIFLENEGITVVEPNEEEADEMFTYVAGKINYNVDTVAAFLDKLATEYKRKDQVNPLSVSTNFTWQPPQYGHFSTAGYLAPYTYQPMDFAMTGLSVRMGGFMTLEANVQGVNKALALDYLDHHFDEILNRMGYTPGPLFNARKTKTVITADGDGTTYGKPSAPVQLTPEEKGKYDALLQSLIESGNPVLADSQAYDDLLAYLKEGGVYVIISGNDMELTKKRILSNGKNGKSGLPVELRNRLLIVPQGGTGMVFIDAQGSLVELEGYRTNALAEYRDQVVHNLDLVYLGDDQKTDGNDFPGFKKVGFYRAVTVTKEADEKVPEQLRDSNIGGLEAGTGNFLKTVVAKAQQAPQQPLFTKEGVASIINEITEGKGSGYQGAIDARADVMPNGQAGAGSTVLSKDQVNALVRTGGSIIRNFLKEIVPYVNSRETSPFSDIAKVEDIWRSAVDFQNNPANYTDEKLQASNTPVRIEVRGRMSDGTAAQVGIIGVPGRYRQAGLEQLRDLAMSMENIDFREVLTNGLKTKNQSLVENGGIDLNQINVNRTGKMINVQFDQAQLNELMQGGFEGFTPVIINMTRISSPFQLLGDKYNFRTIAS